MIKNDLNEKVKLCPKFKLKHIEWNGNYKT
jgi:hypothetical protein